MDFSKEIKRIAKDLVSVEFPSKEALDKYLKEHPGADKSKHSVSTKKKNIPVTSKKPNMRTHTLEMALSKLIGGNVKSKKDGGYTINKNEISSMLDKFVSSVSEDSKNRALSVLKRYSEYPWKWTGGISDSDSDKMGDILKSFLKKHKIETED